MHLSSNPKKDYFLVMPGLLLLLEYLPKNEKNYKRDVQDKTAVFNLFSLGFHKSLGPTLFGLFINILAAFWRVFHVRSTQTGNAPFRVVGSTSRRDEAFSALGTFPFLSSHCSLARGHRWKEEEINEIEMNKRYFGISFIMCWSYGCKWLAFGRTS